MGNLALWNAQKTGILCSRKGAPEPDEVPAADGYLGGFHSPPEKQILDELLKRRANIILCPAWGLDNVTKQFLPALEENRMLILEMKNRDGNFVAPNSATFSSFRIPTVSGHPALLPAACLTGC